MYMNRDDRGLTLTERELLRVLAEREGRVLSHGEIVALAFGWELSDQSDDTLLRRHMANLRAKVEELGLGHIATIRGYGYRWTAAGAAQRAGGVG